MKRKGIGAEDTPFMLLAAVVVLVLVVWLGLNIMGSFVEGNGRQAAVESAIETYKRAKILSLGYDGSSDSTIIHVPEGYALLIDGSIVARTVANKSLNEPLSIRGVSILGEEEILPPGNYRLNMAYAQKDGKIHISW